MLFGNCTNLVAAAKGDLEVVTCMKAARFDFIEASFQALANATDAEFDSVCTLVQQIGLPVPICNSMFPSDIRLTGENRMCERVSEYVDGGFQRAKRLGIKKVILGSDKSRQLPEHYDVDRAYDEFIALLTDRVVPYCEKYGITVLIEPLRRPCNFINTLQDGMRVVRGVNSPYVRLLADTIHMMTSREDPCYVHEISKEYLGHVHISDWDRKLPEYGYSSELTAVLREIHKSGYDGTFSFEAMKGENELSLHRALLELKQKLDA